MPVERIPLEKKSLLRLKNKEDPEPKVAQSKQILDLFRPWQAGQWPFRSSKTPFGSCEIVTYKTYKSCKGAILPIPRPNGGKVKQCKKCNVQLTVRALSVGKVKAALNISKVRTVLKGSALV